MKILMVCQHFYPEEFRINDLSFELTKKGNEVTVLTGLPNYPKGKVLNSYKYFKNRKENINGVKVIRSSLIGRGNNNFSIALNYASFAITSSIKALFMKKNFDIVFAYQLSPISMVWPGIIVSKIKKIPLVIYVQDVWPSSMELAGVKKGTWQYRFFYNMSKKTYNKSNNILVSSKEYTDYFKNELKLKNTKYTYLPNYAEDTYKNAKNINNDKFDIVFAGNIGPAQDVESIVNLANELKNNKDIIFHIVGDGLSKEKCEKLSSKYKLKNIKFYGRHKVDEMNKFYDLADAFIITLKDNEVVNRCEPTKLPSYMLAGKPILGLINGAVNRIINQSKCGIVVSSGNYKEMSKKILEIYQNSDVLKEYGENSIKYYNQYYSKEKIINKLLKELKNIINNL